MGGGGSQQGHRGGSLQEERTRDGGRGRGTLWRKVFQVEGTARAKAQRWDHAPGYLWSTQARVAGGASKGDGGESCGEGVVEIQTSDVSVFPASPLPAVCRATHGQREPGSHRDPQSRSRRRAMERGRVVRL